MELVLASGAACGATAGVFWGLGQKDYDEFDESRDAYNDLRDNPNVSHEAEVAALREEYEGKLEEQRKSQAAVQAARIRDRLMQLAGHGAVRARDEKGEGTQS